MKQLNYIKMEFPARSVNEGFARAAAAAFAAQLDPTMEELGDIRTAVSEAVTSEAFLTPDITVLPADGSGAAEGFADGLAALLLARRSDEARLSAAAAAAEAAQARGFSIETNAAALLALYAAFCGKAGESA